MLLFGVAALVGLAACGGKLETEVAVDKGRSVQTSEQESLLLYFPGRDGRLHAEARLGQSFPDRQQRAVAVVSALLEGPRQEGLVRSFAEGTEVEDVDLVDDRLAYVWFQLPAGGAQPHLGSHEELLAMYSLVESLAANLLGLQGVVPLQGGRQMPTWAGHVDTARPLKPGRFRLLVREDAEGSDNASEQNGESLEEPG